MTENDVVEVPEEPTNQTLFGNQEPLLQKSSRSFAKHDDFVVTTPKKPMNKLVVLAGSMGAVLVLLILALAILKPKAPTTQVTASPSANPVSQATKTQFQARLDELSSDLQDADPSKMDLTVPPVDLNLTLDPIKKN
jgi:hypothetical protein